MNTGKTLFAQLMDFLPWTMSMAEQKGDHLGGVRRDRLAAAGLSP